MNSHLPVMRLSGSSSVAAYDMNPESQTKTFRVLFYLLRTGGSVAVQHLNRCPTGRCIIEGYILTIPLGGVTVR